LAGGLAGRAAKQDIFWKNAALWRTPGVAFWTTFRSRKPEYILTLK
jgi:hypothetical protein